MSSTSQAPKSGTESKNLQPFLERLQIKALNCVYAKSRDIQSKFELKTRISVIILITASKRGVAPPSAGPSSSVSTPLRPAGGSYSQDAGANSSEPSAKRQKSFGAESRTGSVTSAGYSYHSPGGQAAPYSAYPPSSSAHVQSGYYSQYPSSYAPTSYAYPSYGAQQHYPMSSAAPYRGQQTQPESTSSYPPPSTYASSAYPYPSYATAGGYSYAQNSNSAASKEGMADPSNPPRLAPLQGYDAKNAQYQQQPGQQSQTQRGSYDWPTQGR